MAIEIEIGYGTDHATRYSGFEQAAQSDEPVWITCNGERIAVIVPMPVIQAISDVIRPMLARALQSIATVFGIHT